MWWLLWGFALARDPVVLPMPIPDAPPAMPEGVRGTARLFVGGIRTRGSRPSRIQGEEPVPYRCAMGDGESHVFLDLDPRDWPAATPPPWTCSSHKAELRIVPYAVPQLATEALSLSGAPLKIRRYAHEKDRWVALPDGDFRLEEVICVRDTLDLPLFVVEVVGKGREAQFLRISLPAGALEEPLDPTLSGAAICPIRSRNGRDRGFWLLVETVAPPPPPI